MKKIILILFLIGITNLTSFARPKPGGWGGSISFEVNMGHDSKDCEGKGETCFGVWTGMFGQILYGTYPCHIGCWGSGSKCKLSIGIGMIAHQSNPNQGIDLSQVDITGATPYLIDFQPPSDYNEISMSIGNNYSVFIPQIGAYMNVPNQISQKHSYDDIGIYYVHGGVTFSQSPLF